MKTNTDCLIDSIVTITLPSPPWEKPPSVFDWLEKMLDPRIFQGFPTLDMLIGQPDKPQTSHASQSLVQLVTGLTPRTVALSRYLSKIRRSEQTPSLLVETMLTSGIDNRMLETFPSAVVAGIRDAIVECQSSPPTTWNETLLEIVGREDLHMLLRPDADWSPGSASLMVRGLDLALGCRTDEYSLPLELLAATFTAFANQQKQTILLKARRRLIDI